MVQTRTGQISTSSETWTTWTPTITATAGALTTASGTGRYIQIGKTVFYTAALTITTNGTGSGSIQFTLPVTTTSTAWTSNWVIGHGREGAATGKSLTVTWGSTTTGLIRNYDNTYPASSGAVLYISGTYEAV